MNLKKIVIVSLIALAVFSSMSIASAGFLDGMFGSDQNITVGGETFTIPAGFELNESESENSTSDGINSTTVYYETSSEYISIHVQDTDSDDIMPLTAWNGAVNKTIANKTGHYLEQNGEGTFEYEVGNKTISISTNNAELLEKIIN